MLTQVRLKNYKAIAALDLPLEPLTVFVGPNGAGKTSVLEAIYRLCDPRLKAELPKDAGVLLRKGAQGPLEIGLSLSPIATDGKDALDEAPEVHVRAELPTRTSESHPLAAVQMSGSSGAWLGLKAAVFARLSPRSLAAASYSEEEEPVLRPEGAGLASVLADLAASQPERLEEIIAQTRMVIPMLRRVRTQRMRMPEMVMEIHTVDGQRVQVQKVVERLGHRVVVDMASGDSIPIDHVSEGTVLLLGLFTLLCGRQRPELLLLDDLDRALHPKAQADLVAALRRLQAQRPTLQLLATTHSPYLLDELRFEEVRVLACGPDGTVIGAPLVNHPELDRWRDCVRPGELWTARMESWITAQREGPR